MAKCSEKLLKYAKHVRQMRDMQAKYFASKSSGKLIQAKTLEFQIDKETTEIIEMLDGRSAE